MSKKGIKFKAKYGGNIAAEYETKKSNKDGSQIIISKEDNKNGLHMTIHPSGVINISSKNKYLYDIFKNQDLKKYVETRLKELKKIESPVFALILDTRKLKEYATVKSKEHVLDLDSFFDDSEKVEIINDDFSFVSNYKEPFFGIMVFDENDNVFFAAKNKPGYGLLFNAKETKKEC